MTARQEAKLIRDAMAALGRRTSPAKIAAARANGSKPARPGKRRGRPPKAKFPESPKNS